MLSNITRKGSPMHADVYQKLHEFNLHITEGVTTLRSLLQVYKLDAEEVRHYAEYFEELRSSFSGYVTNRVSDDEERVSSRLFAKRRRRKWWKTQCTAAGWKRARKEKAGRIVEGQAGAQERYRVRKAVCKNVTD